MLDFHASVLQEKREQAAEAAAMKKDPDAYRAKMEAMEVARMRMQEKYDQVERNVVGLECRGYLPVTLVANHPFGNSSQN